MANNKTKNKSYKQPEHENSFTDGSFIWLLAVMAIFNSGKNDMDERLKKLEAKVDMLEKFM